MQNARVYIQVEFFEYTNSSRTIFYNRSVLKSPLEVASGVSVQEFKIRDKTSNAAQINVLGTQIGTGRKHLFSQIILIKREISKYFMLSVCVHPGINVKKQNEIVKS